MRKDQTPDKGGRRTKGITAETPKIGPLTGEQIGMIKFDQRQTHPTVLRRTETEEAG
jgi:hypothetical protein